MEKPEATAQLVKEEIENSLYLKEVLKKGLINYSALTRDLLEKIKLKNKKANFNSVLISIQRYYDEIRGSKSPYEEFTRKVLPNCELIVKNRILTLTYERNKKVMDNLIEISKKIRWDSGDSMLIIQGTSEVAVITDQKSEKSFDKIKSHLIERQDKLSALSLREPEAEIYSKKVSGFLSYITMILANKEINIYETATTYKQLIFVIDERDVMKAYECLNKVMQKRA